MLKEKTVKFCFFFLKGKRHFWTNKSAAKLSLTSRILKRTYLRWREIIPDRNLITAGKNKACWKSEVIILFYQKTSFWQVSLCLLLTSLWWLWSLDYHHRWRAHHTRLSVVMLYVTKMNRQLEGYSNPPKVAFKSKWPTNQSSPRTKILHVSQNPT